MKKILVLLPFAFYRPSGSPLSSYYRIRALLTLGNEVDIVAYPHGDEYEGLNIIRMPSKKIFRDIQAGEWKKKIVYDLLICLNLIFIRKKYDLIFVHSSLIYLIPFFKWVKTANYVAMVHGNLDVELTKWSINKTNIFRDIAVWYENKVLSFYDFVIFEHKSVASKLSNVSNNKSMLIPLAVFPKQIYLVSVRPEGEFNVVYTGSFVEVQNLVLVLETASLLKSEFDIQFILVGANEEEYVKYIALCKKYTVESQVLVLKRMPQSELDSIYAKADLLVSPRIYGHDTPMKIIEYLSLGICVLASDRPIHREVLNNDISCLVEPSPEKYAEAIRTLRSDRAYREMMGRRGLNHFLTNYSFTRMVNDYGKLFLKLLDSTSSTNCEKK